MYYNTDLKYIVKWHYCEHEKLALTNLFGENLWIHDYEIWLQETRNIAISYMYGVKRISILELRRRGSQVWQTDRQTDRQTRRPLAIARSNSDEHALKYLRHYTSFGSGVRCSRLVAKIKNKFRDLALKHRTANFSSRARINFIANYKRQVITSNNKIVINMNKTTLLPRRGADCSDLYNSLTN